MQIWDQKATLALDSTTGKAVLWSNFTWAVSYYRANREFDFQAIHEDFGEFWGLLEIELPMVSKVKC